MIVIRLRNKDFIRGVVFRDRNKNGDLDENESNLF
jgi:hypothetical protein